MKIKILRNFTDGDISYGLGVYDFNDDDAEAEAKINRWKAEGKAADATSQEINQYVASNTSNATQTAAGGHTYLVDEVL